MRRLTTALTALAAAAALAFAPVTTAEEAGTTSLDLTAVTDGTTVNGTLTYGGALTTGADGAGDPSIPMAGLDVGDLRLEQVGRDLLVTLDVLDATAGEVAPTALYKVDVTNSLSLMAFRGPDAWDYQVADFSDGYVSSPAEGSFDGSTITWTVPSSTFGSAGSLLAPGYLSSQGVSPGGLASLQLSAFVTIDAGKAIAAFTTGGRIDVTVTDAAGEETDAIAFADTKGGWSFDGSGLAPGTYTVTAESAYADLEATITAALVIE